MSEHGQPQKFGEVCSHGRLGRACYTCELEAERDQLKAEVKRLWSLNDLGEYQKNLDERDRLRARVERLEKALGVIWGGKGGCEEHHCAEIAEEALRDGEGKAYPVRNGPDTANEGIGVPPKNGEGKV